MTHGRVLIVDDQSNWREVISSLLSDSGYDVKTASSVVEAWTLLDTETFDIAILDVRLVDKNPYDIQGIELLDQMRARLENRFPIIIMTGYSFEGMEEILRQNYGVRDFLKKGSSMFHDINAFRGRIASILYE